MEDDNFDELNRDEIDDSRSPFIAYDSSASIPESFIDMIPAEEAVQNLIGHFDTLKTQLECKNVNIERLESDIANNRFENEGELSRNRQKLETMKLEYDAKTREMARLFEKLRRGIAQTVRVDDDTRMNELTAQLNEKSSENRKLREEIEKLRSSLHLKNEEAMKLRNEKNAVLSEQIEAIEVIRNQLNERINEVQILNDQIEKNRKEFDEKMRDRNNEFLKKMEEKETENEILINENASSLSELNEAIEVLRSQLNMKNNEIHILNDQISKNKKEFDETMKKSVAQREELFEQLEEQRKEAEQLKQQNHEIDELKLQMKYSLAENDKAHTKNIEEIRELEERLQLREDQNNELRKMLKESEEKIEHWTKVHNEKCKIIMDHACSNLLNKNENENLKRDLTVNEGIVKKLNVELRNIKNQLADSEKQKSEKIEDLRECLREKSLEVANKDKNVDRLQVILREKLEEQLTLRSKQTKDIAEKNSIIEKKSVEIQKINEQLEGLNNQIELEKQRVVEKCGKINKLEESLRGKSEEIAIKEKEMVDMENTYKKQLDQERNLQAGKKQEIAEKNDIIEKQTVEIQNNEDQLASLNKTVDFLRGALISKNSIIEKQNVELQHIKGQLDDMNNQVKVEKQNVVEKFERIIALEEKFRKKSEEVENKEKQMVGMENIYKEQLEQEKKLRAEQKHEITGNISIIEKLNMELQSVKDQLASLNNQIEVEKQNVSEETEHIHNLEKSLREKSEKIVEDQNKINRLEKHFREQLDEVMELRLKQTLTINQLERTLTSKNSVIENQDGELQKIKHQLADVENKIKVEKQNVIEKSGKINELEESLRKKSEEVENKRKEMVDMENKYKEKLEQEKKFGTEQKHALTETISSIEKLNMELHNVQGQVTSLNNQIKVEKENVVEKTEKINELEKILREKSEEVENKGKEMVDMENKYKEQLEQEKKLRAEQNTSNAHFDTNQKVGKFLDKGIDKLFEDLENQLNDFEGKFDDKSILNVELSKRIDEQMKEIEQLKVQNKEIEELKVQIKNSLAENEQLKLIIISMKLESTKPSEAAKKLDEDLVELRKEIEELRNLWKV